MSVVTLKDVVSLAMSLSPLEKVQLIEQVMSTLKADLAEFKKEAKTLFIRIVGRLEY